LPSLNIAINKDQVTIDQSRYIEDTLMKYSMHDARPSKLPADKNQSLQSDGEPDTEFPFRSLVGSLLYIAIGTRPDIANAVREISQHISQPTKQHVGAAKSILRYLSETKDYGLVFKKANTMTITAFADADFANNVDTRRSHSGYVIKVGHGVVSWCSKRQETVAQSSTEAEFYAVAAASNELQYLRQLLSDMDVETTTPTLYEDNQPCIKLLHNLCSINALSILM
jgi:hypothetical protein